MGWTEKVLSTSCIFEGNYYYLFSVEFIFSLNKLFSDSTVTELSMFLGSILQVAVCLLSKEYWLILCSSYGFLLLQNNLLMLAILAFEVTIYRHQEYYRCRNNLTAPETKTIFHDVTRLHLDDGVLSCLKYFVNYFFYKFGLEVNLVPACLKQDFLW